MSEVCDTDLDKQTQYTIFFRQVLFIKDGS